MLTGRLLTVAEVAAQLQVKQAAVLSWIARKELIATNVARLRTAKKPRWRISTESLCRFLTARTTERTKHAAPANQLPKTDPHYIEYF